jgi:hypothetical protein
MKPPPMVLEDHLEINFAAPLSEWDQRNSIEQFTEESQSGGPMFGRTFPV